MRQLLWAAVLVASQTTQPAPPPGPEAFERHARDIVVLGPNQFLYGFRETGIPTDGRAPVQRFAKLLEDGRWQAGQLLPLLDHADPRVRSLALVAAYNLEDPKLLPRLVRLVDDDAPTFPAMLALANCCVGTAKITPQMVEPQTVGDLATAIVNVYLKTGGYFYGPHGKADNPGFDDYWKARAERTSAAGWWSVRLARAGQSTSPTPKERRQAIARLRTDIDRLAEPDRTYILLWLNGDAGSDALVSTDELVRMSNALGADSLLDLVTRKIRSSDPDFQPRANHHYRYARMTLFVLQHARALLRPGDAALLLAQETWERDFQNHGISEPLLSPWWAIAAAQLNDRAGLSILTAAYSRFQGTYDGFHRLELAQALWRQIGDEEVGTVVDWFYRELAHPRGHEANALRALLETEGRPAALLLKTLVADPRFDELNWKSVETLVQWMNAAERREIVPEEELRSARSPLGIDFYFKDRDKALGQYPKETGELLARLSRWRVILRQMIAGR